MSRLKDDIISMSRAERAKLANASGINREDLADFAELGLSLTDEQMAKLSAWHAIHELRSMFSQSARAPFVAGMIDSGIISAGEAIAFAAGETDLDETKRKAIRDHFTGSVSAYVPPPTAPLSAQPANGGMPEAIARRGAILRELNKLSTVELEAIAASLKGRQDA